MTLNDVLALTKAGFSKDDIVRMSGGIPQPEPAPAVPPQPNPTVPPQPEPAPAVPPVDMAAEFAALRDSIIDGIRAANLAGTKQPPQVTAEDVLASIINPPTR